MNDGLRQRHFAFFISRFSFFIPNPPSSHYHPCETLVTISSMSYPSLADFLEELRQSGQLVRVEAKVSPCLEAAEITSRVAQQGGPALLFGDVRGTPLSPLDQPAGDRKAHLPGAGRPLAGGPRSTDRRAGPADGAGGVVREAQGGPHANGPAEAGPEVGEVRAVPADRAAGRRR